MSTKLSAEEEVGNVKLCQSVRQMERVELGYFFINFSEYYKLCCTS
ncbi:MAG: hypothetical protein J7647_10160 [Cyanobacteria bacterium SBLK]|nr:hypothetical protein [Cyanobacteria bacterium SBLK]